MKGEMTMSYLTREEILVGAYDCVCKSKNIEYNSPENNFATIADMWTSYIRAAFPHGVDKLEAKDVAAMMVLFKMARVATGRGKADNWIDAAGYAACGGETEKIIRPDTEVSKDTDCEMVV